MIRAVICDDEPDAISIIEYFVQSENIPIHIVGTASNGVEALQLIQEQKPELVFMDIHMPYLNGFEIIQKCSGSKFIIITAYGSFEYAQQALRLGAYDIIAKPIDFEQLTAAVTRAVGWNITGNDLVDTILNYIHTHYSEKIELEDLANLTFCSEVHVARIFKKVTGTTVVSYTNKIRIDKAVYLLDNEHISVKEAAEQVGYQNLNNFYKYFKLYTGMTPAAYIKEKRSSKKEGR